MSDVFEIDKKKTEKLDKPVTSEEDPLITMAETGRQLGKSGNTIKRWCQDGLLESAIRLPSGLWAVRKSEINKLLRASAIKQKVK